MTMANPTLPAAGHTGCTHRRAVDPPGRRVGGTPTLVSVGNSAAATPDRRLWLSGVPRQELDALSTALRQGPLDAHFFLTLEPGFHRTPLAMPMAQALVDDALHGLLPARLPRAEQAAWRTCLAGLLTLPRAAWEVACAPLRPQLTHAVATTNTLLGVMRDALYRPFDMPGHDWRLALDDHRARSVPDCREVVLGLQRTPRATLLAQARQQLQHWLPDVPPASLDRAMSQVTALAEVDAGWVDPRTALPALFDAVDGEQRALIPDAQRAALLAALDRCANDRAEPLLATAGGAGDHLGRWLLSVAARAGQGPCRLPGFRQALGEALAYALSAVPGQLAGRTGGEPAQALAGTAPFATAGMSMPLPQAAVPVASGAAARGGRGLLAMATGLVGSGAGLATLGWRWAFGTKPSTPTPAGVREAVGLLDHVIARDGGGSLWHALWHRVHAADGDEPERLVAAISDQLEANEIAAEVVDAFDLSTAHNNAGAVRRVRRTPETVLSPPADHAGRRRVEQVRRASGWLIEAARHAPPPPALPEMRDAGMDLAVVRSRMSSWIQAMGSNATTQHARLATAWRDIVASEQDLVRARAALPQLDAHLAEQVATDVRAVTGQTIDPSQIYLDIFQVNEPWPEWEARQLRPPLAAFRTQLHKASRDQRVRSDLVSAHTLVGAALLPFQADPVHAALYYRGVPETYFPVQECRELTLAQFNQAVRGRDYLGAFRRRYDACLEDAWYQRATPGSEQFVAGISRQLSGAAVLLNAAGQLGNEAAALVQTLVDFPARFSTAEASNGRALALPGRQIDVHALAANASGRAVPLHGVVLVTASAVPGQPEPPVLVVSDSRTPLVEAFASREMALQCLTMEVARHLPARVAVADHGHWRQARPPVLPAYVIEGDFRWSLFMQAVQLRHAQLRPPGMTLPIRVRQAFNALDATLAARPLPVPIPVLAAAAELAALDVADIVARGAAHWSARFPASTPGALRNAGMDGARWLHALSAGRRLIEHSYPSLLAFVQRRLDEEIMRRYRIAFDSSNCYIVAFSGGLPSRQASSGWIHSHHQRLHAASFAECVMTRAQDFDDDPAQQFGLYHCQDSAFFDESSEVIGLLPEQLLSMARELDVQGEYLAALDAFWQAHETQVLTQLRGGYLHACWQQYAEGSLSVRGMQLALGVFGEMDAADSQDPAYLPVPRNGTRTGWLGIHGMASSVLHITDDQGPEVVLYFAHDRDRFHEFSSVADMMGWVERAVGTELGRQWLESAFDLADLQDGWISNGVHTAMGNGARAMFGDGRGVSPIAGEASVALVRRLRDRSRRDAQTLMTSPWEAFRRHWTPRLARFDQAVGLASVFMPALLPLVAIGSVVELAVGLEQAIDGDTARSRQAGASAAAAGLFGLALSAPLGTARLAALAVHDGARLQPAVQAAVSEQVRDPLQHLAGRYSQPVVLAGARAADNGVYDYLSRQYIGQGDHAYEVAFDRSHRTWRLRDPRPGSSYHPPVRLNADGLWEPHSDVGLRGGAPEATVAQEPARRSSLDLTYRNALNLHMERLRSRSLDSAMRDFKWGQDHWQRVVAPALLKDSTGVARMKELFVSGTLDPVQQGALSVIIERLESTLRAERYAMMETMVDEGVSNAGGRFHPASQGLLGEANGSTSGMCTGLSRIMAVALGRGEERTMLEHLRDAIGEPGRAGSAATFGVVRDAQGVALERGSMSSTSLIALSQLAGFLGGVAENSEFILSGSRHSMTCAVRVASNGRREFLLYDPNFGLASFDREDRFARWLPTLFATRSFSELLGAGMEGRPETLAELYGAFSTPGSLRYQFHLRQVHSERLQQQAVARGWGILLDQVHQATAHVRPG